MKHRSSRLALLVAAPLFFAGCLTPIDPPPTPAPIPSPVSTPTPGSVNDTDIPADLQARYLLDAGILAIRESYKQQDTTSLRVSDRLLGSVYGALVAVHHFHSANRDTAIGIHIYDSSPHTVWIVVKDDASWLAPWLRGELHTGQPTVDRLVAAAGLRLVGAQHSAYDPEQRVQFYSDGFVLVDRLSRQLKQTVPEIPFAYTDTFIADPGILLKPMETGFRLDYQVGWGDCQAGCISHRVWSFEVNADGQVRDLGASGPVRPR